MSETEKIADPAKGTAALSKGVKLLNAIASAESAPTARQLADHTGMPRPTVYRLLAALKREGLVRQTENSGAYRLGPALVVFAHRALEQTDIRDIAREHIEALRDITGETVHLAVFNKGEMLYIDKVESLERVRMTCVVGASAPLHTTAVGKSYLAALPDSERERIIEGLDFVAVTDHSITTAEAFRAQIRRVRTDGFARDEQENERDIVCFGAPIIDRLGAPVAAISVSVPRFRLNDAPLTAYAAPLLETCQHISSLLGARPGTWPQPAELAKKAIA